MLLHRLSIFCRPFPLLLLVFLLLPLATELPAQVPEMPAPAPVEAEAEAEAPGELPIPEELSSPRETMMTFLESFYGEKDTEARLSTLNLPAAIREEGGILAAWQLKQCIDRIRYVDEEKIPVDTEDPYVFFSHPAGSIVIAPDEEGIWQFTEETLESIHHLYDAIEDWPIIPGVVDAGVPPLPIRVRGWISENAPYLRHEGFLLEHWQWIGLLIIVFAGLLAGRGIAWIIVELVLARILSKRDRETYEELRKNVTKPFAIALTAWFWWWGLGLLGLPEFALLVLLVAVKVVTGISFVWTFYMVVDVLAAWLAQRAKKSESKVDDLVVPFVRRGLKVFGTVVGLVFIADIFDVEPTSLLAGLGIGGLAFALAAKDTLENVFGSLTVLADRPFEIGDWVKIGDVDGNVESVGFRSTKIRTFYNSVIHLPNAQLIRATIDNMGRRRYRRIYTHISVTYDTPPEKIEAFCEGIRELVRTHPYTRKDMYHVYLNEFAASALNIILYVFHETPDWSTELRERHRLFLDIIRLAQKLGVEFAFPTQTLHVYSEEKGEGKGEFPSAEEEVFQIGRQQARELVKGKYEQKPPPVVME